VNPLGGASCIRCTNIPSGGVAIIALNWCNGTNGGNTANVVQIASSSAASYGIAIGNWVQAASAVYSSIYLYGSTADTGNLGYGISALNITDDLVRNTSGTLSNVNNLQF
jgi:hypothetical protein